MTTRSASFWDTSGIVLLCCHQAASSAARSLVRRARRMVVWWGMPVEACSALARLQRERAISEVERGQALARLAVLRRSCAEIQPTQEVRTLAEALPGRLAVRAADALQLAAALVHCDQKPWKRSFICFDARLSAAAKELGFHVLPEA